MPTARVGSAHDDSCFQELTNELSY